MTIYAFHKEREDEECEDGRSHEPADNHRCQRSLALAADAVT